MEIGEAVAPPAVLGESDEKSEPPCKRIYVHVFRGNRDGEFVRDFKRRLDASRTEGTPGPSPIELLLYAGHVGVSFNARTPIYGFTPKTHDPAWKVMDNLKAGNAYPGAVGNDTAVFVAAEAAGLDHIVIEHLFPPAKYDELHAKFTAEAQHCSHTYSFPGGQGDCNCATWPATIDVPIPSGDGNLRVYGAAAESAPKKQKHGACEE